MRKNILILGPNPFNPKINHSGGQLTAITHLVGYIEKYQMTYDILDTFRSTFPPPSAKEKLLSARDNYTKLKKLLKENRYEGALVFGTHGLGFWEKLFFSLIIEKSHTKVLFFIRSGHFMDAVIQDKHRVPLKKFLMNKISYVGYQGGKWEEFYDKVGIKKEKLVKILNWIEIPSYTKERKDDEKTVFLYVGWMVEKKGVNELLDVILEHKDLSQHQFIFAGGGTLLDELKERVKDKNLTNVLFTGWIDKEALATYYKKSDVLILPSHAEGFPNVILEALGYHLSIISTDIGAISESVIDGYNGYLIEPKDKVLLYQKIKKIGDSKLLQEEFSKKSAEIIVKNHSINVNCEKIFTLFKTTNKR